MISSRVRAAAARAAATVAVLALALEMGAWIAPPAAVAEPGDDPTTCTRDIEYRGLLIEWSFDPCIPEGAPLPPDVESEMYEDWLDSMCQSPSPTPPASPTGFPTGSPSPTPPASPTGFPTSLPSATQTVAAQATAFPTSTFTETVAPPTGSPSADPCPPLPTASPNPDPSLSPPPSGPPSSQPPSQEPSASPSPETCPAPQGEVNDDDASKLEQARKDRICPKGRNPENPVVVVATGDSVTSAHIQNSYAYPMGNCKGNTAEDDRKLPGNHMGLSYVGKYVNDINKDVVEYYNFARTGHGTREIMTAAKAHKDSCGNDWGRDFPPVDLADRAIRQAKTDHKAAYFVSTGGVNNTNWTDTLGAVAKCGVIDHFRGHIQDYITRNRLPWTAVVRWFDAQGRRTTKDKVIDGGACHGRITGNITGRRYIHRRVEIPAYNGPTKFAEIRKDVTDIVNKMVNAGADKVVWMAYYDISPAQIDVGLFAETYRLALSRRMRGMLPGRIPSHVVDLIDDPAWKTTAQKWVTDLNAEIKKAIPNNAKVKFQDAPALNNTKIQKTMLGGCPHPNDVGHTDLSKTLDAAFKAL
jgi:hypothetical protein